MLDKDQELGCFEILKHNFPNLKKRGLVIGLYEFLASNINLQDYICKDRTPKQAALDYIQAQRPYIVLDETEGYKCIFFRGRHFRAHYDVTHSKMIRFIEETL